MNAFKFVILTISDSCSKGTRIDRSGIKLLEFLKRDFPLSEIEYKVLPDDESQISMSLVYYSDVHNANLIFTTGGTGFSERDVTPDATRKIITKMADGIMIGLYVGSLKNTPMSMMSRAVSGFRNKTLIINLPGNIKAVQECYDIIQCVLPHALDVIKENLVAVNAVHTQIESKPHTCNKEDSITSIKSVETKNRVSPYPMVNFEIAENIIRNTIKQHFVSKVVKISYLDAFDYVAAEDILAEEPFPPFNASVKDGYACMFEDGAGERKVLCNIAAGDNPDQVILSGTCAEINTGAPIPKGANCVVQVEDTKLIKENNGKEDIIEILVAPKKDQDIRSIGSDINKGDIVIEKGKILQPADIGLCATIGKIEINVYEKPTIGLLSTGNELCDPSTKTVPKGFIRDSNKATLQSFLNKYKIPSKDYGIVEDDPIKIKNKLNEIFLETDILITTGSVSMGNKDFLKTVLKNDFSANILFGRLNIRPGKPTTCATCTVNNKQKLIFALPGNPVSALVITQLLVYPAIMISMGVTKNFLCRFNVMMGEDVELDLRPHFARALMYQTTNFNLPLAYVTGNQISSRLLSSAGADVLLKLPSSKQTGKILPKNSLVMAYLIK